MLKNNELNENENEYFVTHQGYWKGKTIPAEAIVKQKITKKLNHYHHTEE